MLDEKQTNKDIEWTDICDIRTEHTGIQEHYDTVRKGSKLLYEYLNAGWVREPIDGNSVAENIKQTTTINADKTQTHETQFYIEDESKLRDYNYLLQLHNYDPHLFEIVNAKNSKWNMGSGDNAKTLYSSKVTVKPKDMEVLPEDISSWFDKLDRNYSKPVAKPSRAIYDEGDKLLIIPISDLHYNLQATMFTTGNNYNCTIAEKLFFDVINDVLSRTSSYKFDKIIFTIGGDMMNADSPSNTTYKGTPQDCDIHYLDACEALYAMTVKAVDILKDVAPVQVLYIPSNHDLCTGFQLAKFIAAWFRNEEKVTVDYSPLPRKYIKWGKTLFALMHDGDVKKLPKLIPDEARDFWSDIDFSEVFLQHLHSEHILSEENNMRIQRLPAFCAKSKWTKEQGYNARRQCKSFIYDKDDGLLDVIYSVVK